jgi:hypothetical protein
MAGASRSRPAPRIESEDTWKRWRAIVERVRARRPDVAAVLDHATPLAVDETLVELGWGNGDVLRERASEPGCWAELCQAARDELGTTPRVVFAESSPAGGERATLAGIDAQAREDVRREALRRVRNHPRVTEVIDIFGARLKDVRLPPD